MELTLTQPAQFAALLHCGLVVGALYELFGLLRIKRMLVIFSDILFCLVAGAIVLLYWYCAGRLQWQPALAAGFACGLVLQFFSLRPIIKSTVQWLLGKLRIGLNPKA